MNRKNRRQTFSLKRTGKKENKDIRNDQQLSSETHVYQYSFRIPVNQSGFDTARSDIHNAIQMSTHQSSSQIDIKKKKIRSCTHQGCREDVADFRARGGQKENPNTFQQQMCLTCRVNKKNVNMRSRGLSFSAGQTPD